MKRCVWLNDDDDEELMLLGYIVSHGKKKLKRGLFHMNWFRFRSKAFLSYIMQKNKIRGINKAGQIDKNNKLIRAEV